MLTDGLTLRVPAADAAEITHALKKTDAVSRDFTEKHGIPAETKFQYATHFGGDLNNRFRVQVNVSEKNGATRIRAAVYNSETNERLGEWKVLKTIEASFVAEYADPETGAACQAKVAVKIEHPAGQSLPA